MHACIQEQRNAFHALVHRMHEDVALRWHLPAQRPCARDAEHTHLPAELCYDAGTAHLLAPNADIRCWIPNADVNPPYGHGARLLEALLRQPVRPAASYTHACLAYVLVDAAEARGTSVRAGARSLLTQRTV